MPLKLPDAGLVNPEDSAYVEYLDESIQILYRMMVKRHEEIRQCSSGEDITELIQEIKEISGRHTEFIKKALELAVVNTVYEPQDVPTHAYLLHEVGDDCFVYVAKVDFSLKKLGHPDKEIIFDSREEMQGDGGIEKVLQGETDASIHVVFSPVKSVPVTPYLMIHTAKKVHDMMEAKHPLFDEVNSPPHQSCHMCNHASALPAILNAIGIVILRGFASQMPTEEKYARRYEHLTRSFSGGDPRLS